MAKYRVLEKSFINGAIVEAGEVIEYDLPEGTTASGNIELVEAEKPAAKKPAKGDDSLA